MSEEIKNLGNDDFAKTIEESKQAIAQEAQKDVKRRPGRPRKNADQSNGGSSGPGPVSVQNPGPMPGPGGAPAPNISQYLETPLKALSKIPAKKHNIEELALSDDEAKACAEALNQCLSAFVPNMNEMSPKTAAVLGAFMVFGSIGFTKYQIYLEKKPKEIDQKPEPEIQETIAQNQGHVTGSDYFARQ